LSWPPLKKWWRTMLLASSKNVTTKITMNRNFANPNHRGCGSSAFTLFRIVTMNCSPVNHSRGLGLLERAGCPLFLQVLTRLDEEECPDFLPFLSLRDSGELANPQAHSRKLRYVASVDGSCARPNDNSVGSRLPWKAHRTKNLRTRV
jgi:hypothetical protein